MEYVYYFTVESDLAQEVNVFPRFNGPYFNIDGRYGLDVANADEYKVVVRINPNRTNVGQQVTLTVTATRNGINISGISQVSLTSSDTNIAVVPVSMSLFDGTASIGVIGLAEGIVQVTATLIVGGRGYTSVPVEIEYATFEPPLDPNSTGYGKVVFNVEPIIAQGLLARPQRLSHADQKNKFVEDDGLIWADYYGAVQSLTFIAGELLK